MPWLKRCGAFLMVFMICRTPDDPCRRSKLDELIVDVDCCGCGWKAITLLLLLSKMVGIAVAVWLKPLLPPENKFNSFAVDGVPLFDERRFRNDNDFKRFNLVDSLLFDAGDDCFCRSTEPIDPARSNWQSFWNFVCHSMLLHWCCRCHRFYHLLVFLSALWSVWETKMRKRERDKAFWNVLQRYRNDNIMNYALECFQCIQWVH